MGANRRGKLRSHTSDDMDRWKSRGGKSQRTEEKKKEDQRIERMRKKKMCAKRSKSRESPCLSLICGSGGSKSKLAKGGGWSHLADRPSWTFGS